jgi:hypothetical protein
MAGMGGGYIPSYYNYGGMRNELVSDPLSDYASGKTLVDMAGMQNILRVLDTYKKQNLEIVLICDIIGNKNVLINAPQKDFLGAHFMMGQLLSVSEYGLVFHGPPGRTTAGVPFVGSAYNIVPSNVIDAIPVSTFRPKISDSLNVYDFYTIYGPSIGTVEAPDAIKGFFELIKNTPSLTADLRSGYTTPVKLMEIKPK